MIEFPRRVVPLVIGLILVWCTNSPAMAAAKPVDQSYQAMPVDQARDIVIRTLPKFTIYTLPNHTPGTGYAAITKVKVDLSRIEILDANGNADVEVLTAGNIEMPSMFSGEHLIIFNGADRIRDSRIKVSNDEARTLMNALFTLKFAARREPPPENDPAFADIVTTYRQSSQKPELSEDARRFKVQAEEAVKDGDFGDAQVRYQQALEIAPWWPEGHFNRALVLGEIGEFELAMNEMKRYLMLVPGAPDAHAAQDKIYQWERKVSRAG